jgi:acetoacetyl-CoA synthetase
MTGRIAAALRVNLSPRHVPDRILAVSDIPYTFNGKKCEVPVKRILMGTPSADAVDSASLRNPDALAAVLEAARTGPGVPKPAEMRNGA